MRCLEKTVVGHETAINLWFGRQRGAELQSTQSQRSNAVSTTFFRVTTAVAGVFTGKKRHEDFERTFVAVSGSGVPAVHVCAHKLML